MRISHWEKTWQPLDYKIFGELKQLAKQRFDAYYGRCLASGEDPHFGLSEAIRTLADVWSSIDEENVRKAWKRLKGFVE